MKINNNWINIIQNYLLPPTCILCGADGMENLDLCSTCYQNLPVNLNPCQGCAEALPRHSDQLYCSRCLQKQPIFDNAYVPFLHQGVIRYLITSLKFSAHYKNARLLGNLLAKQYPPSQQHPEMIIPVPLHHTRYCHRGFNQSIEIARAVSQSLNIPLHVTNCIRNRNTPHQTGLSAEKRQTNLNNAFSIIKPISVQHIAILDDVMTTGSTLHELACTLKQSGVPRVDVWSCARA